MKKKLLAMISVTMVASMMVTGCGLVGGDSKSDTAAKTDAADKPDTSKGTDTKAADNSSAGGKLKIGMVVNNGGADTYQTTYYSAAEAYAKEIGVDLQLLDPVGDVTTQSNQVQDLINMKCDTIVVWPVNSETAVASVKAISEAGIPVLTANTNVVKQGEQYIKCYVGPSNVEEGKQSAQVMVKDLGSDKKIVEITGPNGYSTTSERSEGMKQGIEGSGIQVVDAQPGEANREKSQQVMENYLVKYAAGDIDAVFCFDDNTAIGAINAIEAAGREGDVKVYAAAAGDYGTVSYVKEGKISGVAMQSPIIDAQTALDFALKVAKGENVDPLNYIETPVATPSNIGSLELTEW